MIKRIFVTLIIFILLWGLVSYVQWIHERDELMIEQLDTQLDQLNDVPPEHLAEYLKQQGLTITGGEYTIIIGDTDEETKREGSDESVLKPSGDLS